MSLSKVASPEVSLSKPVRQQPVAHDPAPEVKPHIEESTPAPSQPTSHPVANKQAKIKEGPELSLAGPR